MVEMPTCSVDARPRPQRRGGDGTGRQTGITLGSDKGSHSLVGFLLELPEEGKRDVRWDPGDAPTPQRQ